MKYGIERILEDLAFLNYDNIQTAKDIDGMNYVILLNYLIDLGRFVNTTIDLAIPIPDDYPRSITTSIHVKAVPQLLEIIDSVPNVRNITASKLGSEWRYWSFKFRAEDEEPTKNLMHQINGVFRNI